MLFRRRKEQEEEDQRREYKRRERLERKFKEREQEWSEHEITRERSKQRKIEDSQERSSKRKREITLDDEDDKSRRRKIRSREMKRHRIHEREDDEREAEIEAQRVEERKRILAQKKAEEERYRKDEERRKQEALKEERWQRGSPVSELRSSLIESPMHGKTTPVSAPFKEVEVRNTSPLSSSRDNKGFSVSIQTNKRSLVAPMATKDLGFSDEPEEDILVPAKRKLSSLDPEIEKKSKEEAAKNVIDKIPAEKEELFAFQIDWNLVDQKNIVSEKMRPWITKKIAEILGEEEPTLIEYVCKKLADHKTPQEILQQLQIVLEEEATVFVIKMWRMLIFTTLT